MNFYVFVWIIMQFRENVAAWVCFHDRKDGFKAFLERVLRLKDQVCSLLIHCASNTHTGIGLSDCLISYACLRNMLQCCLYNFMCDMWCREIDLVLQRRPTTWFS